MSFICLFIGILFLLIGILFANGKLLRYMKAFNEMSEADKEVFQVEKLYRNIGLMIASSGVIFVLNGISEIFSKQGFMIAIMLWLVAAIIDLMYIEKQKQIVMKK